MPTTDGIGSNCPIRADLGLMSLAEVRLQKGESLENALRRFKRKVQTEDIIKEVRLHSYCLKPGAKRRLKKLWRESIPERRLAENRIKLHNWSCCCQAATFCFAVIGRHGRQGLQPTPNWRSIGVQPQLRL